MCKNPPLSPQDRRFVLELKDALRLAHVGTDAMPRKAVWMALGKSESWYSLVLNPEELETLPSLVDLRRYAAITGNAEPLRVLGKWWGDGHDLADQDPHHILGQTLRVDADFAGKLAMALADGSLSSEEARGLIHEAESRLRQA